MLFRSEDDAEHLGAALGGGQRRGPVAAAEVQDLHLRRDPEPVHQRLATAPHGRGDAREVTLLPELAVAVHELPSRRMNFPILTAKTAPNVGMWIRGPGVRGAGGRGPVAT